MELKKMIKRVRSQQIKMVECVCLCDGGYRHFQQYFSYIVAVSFIGGGPGENQRTRGKPQTCHRSLRNFST